MTYEIIDTDSGDTLACFESESATQDALSEMIGALPEAKDSVAVVVFDEEGHAVKSWLPSELLPAL